VGEPNLLPLQLDHPARSASLEVGGYLVPAPDSSVEQADGRPRQGGRRDEEGTRPFGQPRQPVAKQRAQVDENGQRLVWCGPEAAPAKLATDLEREERIASGGLVQAHERRPGEGQAQPRPHEFVESTEAQRAQPEMPQALLPKCAVQLEGSADARLRTDGREQPHRLGIEPPQCKRDQLPRRTIEPLRSSTAISTVSLRESVLSTSAKATPTARISGGPRDSASSSAASSACRCGSGRRGGVLDDLAEQIAEARELQTHFRPHRQCRQDPEATVSRPLHALSPDARLPNPRLPLR
jgi:hypothetical protein